MERDSVITPSYILTQLKEEFGPLFDPCPYNPCWDKEKDQDGLTIPWGQYTFCNPPYSNVKPWLAKAAQEHALGKTIILLLKINIACRGYFKPYEGVELRFFNHRIRFPPHSTCARFGSMLVIFGKKQGYSLIDYR